MRKRQLSLVLVSAILAAVPVWFSSGGGPKSAGSIGKQVDFKLLDTDKKTHHLSALKDAKAFVIVFLGTECPINNQYLPRLNELQQEFAASGVRFFAVNANVQDEAEQISKHAKKYQIAFPVLRDQDNATADHFGAKKTPEAFVLDAGRTIKYQGRIDDRFAINVQKAKATRDDLAEAVKDVLAGKPVSVPTTEVAGCYIGRNPPKAAKGDLTFSKHVAPILQNNCQECHRPGAIGPMPLISYDDVAPWGETIRDVVQEGIMPPWYADPKHGKFSNDRRLSDTDKKTLLDWIKQGMARGDDKDMPPPRQFTEGWRIGKPDVVIPMPAEFDVPAKMPAFGVPYKNYYAETNFTEDKWVVQAETRPGAPEVVHHILVFIIPPGAKFSPGNMYTPVLAGTAPGDMPLKLPTGMAKKVPKGSRLLFQMHYTPNGKAQKDRSEIGLVFAKEPPTKEVLTYPIFNMAFRVPPGDDNYKVESSFTFNKEGWIVGMMPHMHLRGKDFTYHAHYPNGKSEILLSVPRFNFNWQSVFRPADPLHFPAGTKIECIAHFDNSAKNLNNPHPDRWVFWGDQTWQEMMIGWTDVAYAVEKK